MQQEWASEATIPEKIYRPHWRNLLVQFVCYALWLSLWYWIADHVPLLGGSGSPGVLREEIVGGFLFALFMSVYTSATQFLSVYPGGLVCRSVGGYTLYATWADIAGIGPRPRRWYPYGRDGLYLNHGYWYPFWNTRKQAEKGPKIPFIPLSYFDPQWRDHEIGHTLRQRAPWLFTDAMAVEGALTPDASP